MSEPLRKISGWVQAFLTAPVEALLWLLAAWAKRHPEEGEEK